MSGEFAACLHVIYACGVCVCMCVCVCVYHRCRGSSDYDLYFPPAFLQVCPIQTLEIFCLDPCRHTNECTHTFCFGKKALVRTVLGNQQTIQRGQES